MSSSERPQPSRTPLAGIHHLPFTARILQMAGTATDLIVQEIAFFFVLRLQSGVSGEAISILRRVHSVRALLTALFVATQVIGVVPLLSDHTKEIYERALAITAAPSEAIPANSASDRIDPDGDLDDDCCAREKAQSAWWSKTSVPSSGCLSLEKTEQFIHHRRIVECEGAREVSVADRRG